jgi:TPP-dependent 2-oxoacid decarboxylase
MTTYGVGELSAINGLAGAYAEHQPIVQIVGTPSRKALERQDPRRLVHHSWKAYVCLC